MIERASDRVIINNEVFLDAMYDPINVKISPPMMIVQMYFKMS